MNYFLVSVLQAFLPVSLLLGVSWASRRPPRLRPVAGLSLFAFLAGTAAGIHFPHSQQWVLTFTLFQLIVIVLFLISQFMASQRIGYLGLFTLIFIAAVRWGQTPNLSAITATSVVNTDLILNISAILCGVAIVAFSAALIAVCVRQLRYLRWPLLIAFALMLLLPVSGELMLVLMKLQVIGLTKSLLSYVAKVTNAGALIHYVSAALLLLTTLPYLWHVVIPRAMACSETEYQANPVTEGKVVASDQNARISFNFFSVAIMLLIALMRLLVLVTPGGKARSETKRQPKPIAHRKAIASYQNARRIFIVTLLLAVIAIAAQLYWDKVASQPPRLSEAQPVTLSDDDKVHIPLEKVKDGKLHRFVWVADDGKAVRFFVINRYPDKLRLGVVFDACLLCGDQGYVMEGNQVICVACEVHIFIPSIGKPGGCNPVPIEDWAVSGTELTITKKSLEEGLNYFSTVLTLEVTDPVDGSRLTNTKAQHRYTFAGKTYFFSSEANFEAFRDNPEKYVQEAR